MKWLILEFLILAGNYIPGSIMSLLLRNKLRK